MRVCCPASNKNRPINEQYSTNYGENGLKNSPISYKILGGIQFAHHTITLLGHRWRKTPTIQKRKFKGEDHHAKIASPLSHYDLILSITWIPPTFAKKHSDKKADKKVVEVEEITVTATRAEKEPFQVPNAITVLNLKQLEQTNADIASNLLRDIVGVSAQQTTVGQGSPLLRGLTGYQTLTQVTGFASIIQHFVQGRISTRQPSHQKC